jgi:hypothetical protein
MCSLIYFPMCCLITLLLYLRDDLACEGVEVLLMCCSRVANVLLICQGASKFPRPYAVRLTHMYPPPHMTHMYPPPHMTHMCHHLRLVKAPRRVLLLIWHACILLLIWHACILLLICNEAPRRVLIPVLGKVKHSLFGLVLPKSEGHSVLSQLLD